MDLEVLMKKQCQGDVRVITVTLDPKVIKKNLNHLKLPVEPPLLLPARAPPIFQDRDPYQD